MSSKDYPPVNVVEFDDKIDDRLDKLFAELAEKHGLTEAKMNEVISEYLDASIQIIFQPWIYCAYYTGSDFPAVDPAHFRKIDNTRLGVFCDAILTEDSANKVKHEIGLMLQEIRDLRNVLKIQFKYDWTQHRQTFPLIAQMAY